MSKENILKLKYKRSLTSVEGLCLPASLPPSIKGVVIKARIFVDLHDFITMKCGKKHQSDLCQPVNVHDFQAILPILNHY